MEMRIVPCPGAGAALRRGQGMSGPGHHRAPPFPGDRGWIQCRSQLGTLKRTIARYAET